MTPSAELIALIGSFVGAAFALVRLALTQHRAMSDRFVGFLEELIRRQEDASLNFESALAQLSENVRENSALIARYSERLRDRSDGR